MMRRLGIGLGLAVVAGFSLCAVLKAQPPVDPVPQTPVPPVVTPLPQLPPLPVSKNVINNSGNGFGNTIVIGNNGGSSSTVITNTRNGIGNRVMILNDGKGVVLQDSPCYFGKSNAFWSTKVYCDKAGVDVFFCPKTNDWYRYLPTEDVYRPVPNDIRQHLRSLHELDRILDDLLSDF
jgi:hypothetical protein